MKRHRQRKCRHCGELYQPDPRNRWHQQYCSKPDCQAASKRASQARWRRGANGRDYFRGPANVQRVQAWRQSHPGYWRKHRKKLEPLQDISIPQPVAPPRVIPILNDEDLFAAVVCPATSSSTSASSALAKPVALQDVLSAQLALVIGLVAQLSGALQEDLAPHLRRLFLLGRQHQGLGGATHGGGQTSAVPGAVAQNPAAVQLGRSPAGSG